ncbi:hypothetical protein LINPERHAP2_LOCUS9269 [Linum perenne]
MLSPSSDSKRTEEEQRQTMVEESDHSKKEENAEEGEEEEQAMKAIREEDEQRKATAAAKAEGEVLIGLISSNGNASQSSFLYSWSFQLRHFPHWMHSQPLDPEGFDQKLELVVVDVRRRDCGMKVIAALTIGGGFGALGAFMG